MTMSNQRAIALAGLFTSLHIIILLMMNILPGTELLVLFGLPVISAMYYHLTSTRNAFIFAVATSLLVMLLDPIRAVIWIIPSVAIGISYGALIRLRWKSLAIIYGLSFIHAAILFTSLAIGGRMLGVNVWSQLQTQFFHWNQADAWIYGPLMLWLYGLSQSIITHFITSKELARLGINVDWEQELPQWVIIGIALLQVGGIVISFVPSLQALAIWLGSQVFTLSIALYFYTIKRKVSPLIFIISAFVTLLGLMLSLTLITTYPTLILFSLTNFSLLPLLFYVISLYAHPKSE